MDIEPVWYQYATFDDDGFVNGIADDAPEEAKKAYQEEKNKRDQEMKSGKPIPKY